VSMPRRLRREISKLAAPCRRHVDLPADGVLVPPTAGCPATRSRPCTARQRTESRHPAPIPATRYRLGETHRSGAGQRPQEPCALSAAAYGMACCSWAATLAVDPRRSGYERNHQRVLPSRIADLMKTPVQAACERFWSTTGHPGCSSPAPQPTRPPGGRPAARSFRDGHLLCTFTLVTRRIAGQGHERPPRPHTPHQARLERLPAAATPRWRRGSPARPPR
jgi:hypothetical protein